MRLTILGLGMSWLLMPCAGAQSPSPIAEVPPQYPNLKVTSRAVVLDVIVTDSSGKPVTGLAKDAFVVTEQGEKQTISFFEENGAAPLAAPVEMPKLPPDVFTNFSPFPQPPAVNVLLLDSLNTRMESQSNVHSQVMAFLKNAKPGTRSAIFTMGLGLHFIQGFNDDPAVLAAALHSEKNSEVETSVMLKGQDETIAQQRVIDMMSAPEGGHGATAAPREMIAALQRFTEENDTSRSFDRMFRTLANLQRLAAFLEGFPGRKNIIWFAEKVPGIFLTGGKTGNPAFDDELRKTLAMLATARAAIYPVDARGTSNSAQFTAENLQRSSQTGEEMDRNTDQMNAQQLAEQSGGRAFANMNGISEVIDKVTSNSAYFYTLSYVPANAKMDAVFRKIGVKVAGGDYSLSYRRGYFAVDTDLPGSAMRNRDRKLQQLADQSIGAIDPLLPFMDLGMPQSEQILYKVRIVPVAAEEKASTGKKDKIRYAVDFAIDPKDLKLNLGADGLHTGAVNVSLLVYDRYGNVVSREDHVARLNIKPEAYSVFQNAGVPLRLELAVPKGNYWLRTGVYDQGSRKVGTMEVALSSVVPLQALTETKRTVESESAKILAPVPSASVPAFSAEYAVGAGEKITVEQLERLVNQLHVMTDKEASQRLAKCKLTERLSTIQLEQLQKSLPGERSRSALLVIADVSAFLDLPAADRVFQAAPDQAAQRQILSRAVDFVVAATARMPDFLAGKKTLRFQDTKFGISENDPVILTPGLYHLIDKKVLPIRYRNGREEIDSSSDSGLYEAERPAMGLITHGIFGPMLQTVMSDILKGKIGWSRWEQTPSGLVAVFRYSVQREQATYTVTWCCVDAGPGIFRELQTIPRYHGEISVHPESGVITRLVLEADMDPGRPVSIANAFVEYGPVEISGKTCVCPARSATMLVAQLIVEHGKATKSGETYYHQTEERLNVTSVNDSSFEQYHVFGSEMRIVPEGQE
jgi:VWFA-related protein